MKRNHFVIGAAIAIAFLWLTGLSYFTLRNASTSEGLESQTTDMLIRSTENERYLYPVIDIASKTVRMPELMLLVPLNDTSRFLRYDSMGEEGIFFSLDWSVGKQSQQSNFPASCDKMVYLKKEKTDPSEMTYVGELPSSVNGYRYLYKHQQNCFSSEEDMSTLIDSVKQIKSY